ncbi:hypothetical protein San01_41040 [Streptomyces angustmyceticus]|uniref:Uncharacterized protein n=1 Tax=Streptomyces angustmyceticus TaxID=285578 RepID=A0A5J4LBD3_9ACTN|nr:hypothetical protein San01_41040 [Streptomyces angustmyceticus]
MWIATMTATAQAATPMTIREGSESADNGRVSSPYDCIPAPFPESMRPTPLRNRTYAAAAGTPSPGYPQA